MSEIINRIDEILKSNKDHDVYKVKRIMKHIHSRQNQSKKLKDILWLSGLENLLMSCFIDGVDKNKINKVKTLINW